MKHPILKTALAASLALGAFQTANAQDVRVVVGAGDIIFDSGIPYYRVNREPVYVVYDNNVPTYYRVVAKKGFKGTAAPPPWAPAYGWRKKDGTRMAYGYYDANGVWRWY